MLEYPLNAYSQRCCGKSYNLAALYTVHVDTRRKITMLFKDWKHRNNST